MEGEVKAARRKMYVRNSSGSWDQSKWWLCRQGRRRGWICCGSREGGEERRERGGERKGMSFERAKGKQPW